MILTIGFTDRASLHMEMPSRSGISMSEMIRSMEVFFIASKAERLLYSIIETSASRACQSIFFSIPSAARELSSTIITFFIFILHLIKFYSDPGTVIQPAFKGYMSISEMRAGNSFVHISDSEMFFIIDDFAV